MNFPVFDLHCDTAYALLGKDITQMGSLRQNAYHFDLERAKTFPGFVQTFACFTTPEMVQWHHKSPTTIFELEMMTVLREIESNQDMIGLAYDGRDIERHQKQGKISAVLSIEGPAGFDYDPALLEDLYKVGFRITTLGWNESNPLTGSHLTGEGLTDLGREYVKEAQRLGMCIDVSHISDQGFWDIMNITESPVIASHSNSRSLWDHSRNLTNDMFRAICEKDGVAGINLYSGFLGQNPDINTVADHILHFMELDPSGTHIALGGDLDGCDSLPAGISGVQDYHGLAECLLHRGLSEKCVYNIFWNNALGVFTHALRNNKK